MRDLIEITDLIKRYDGHTALDSVSMSVEEGTVHGLLGPNGAGKSTLIRILNHIIDKDSGEVKLDGETVTAASVRHIGYMPEERGLYKKMKVLDHIVYLGRLKGMSRNDAREAALGWLRRMNLEEWKDKKIEALSKGMAQKVQFIGTVVHRPKLLVFDEPFSGFDPVNAEHIKKEMLELNRQGATILFSTHNMGSVEEVCRNITLINKAKVVLDGNVHNVRQLYKKHIYRISIAEAVLAPADNLFTIENLQTDPLHGSSAIVRLATGINFRDVVSYLNERYTLIGFSELLPSMNEIFIETVTQKATNE
ncbi:MAG: ATP-binding cassette domain-containing protein [Muribaculum sp.]|nr:ATP-binding cassette domain-containing protein [Muribaculaceae bacterium]MCM1081719.1 ATP-binding cassette domain-containing protein [Muribaculum sp.]